MNAGNKSSHGCTCCADQLLFPVYYIQKKSLFRRFLLQGRIFQAERMIRRQKQNDLELQREAFSLDHRAKVRLYDRPGSVWKLTKAFFGIFPVKKILPDLSVDLESGVSDYGRFLQKKIVKGCSAEQVGCKCSVLFDLKFLHNGSFQYGYTFHIIMDSVIKENRKSKSGFTIKLQYDKMKSKISHN